MGRPRKLTDEEIAAAQVMWLAGARRKIIADRFGVDRETIRRALRRIKNAAKPDGRVMRQISDSQTITNPPILASSANR